MFHFYTPWKHQTTKGFPMFLGGIEMEHWLWNELKEIFWENHEIKYLKIFNINIK